MLDSGLAESRFHFLGGEIDFAARDHEFDISVCGIRERFGRRESPICNRYQVRRRSGANCALTFRQPKNFAPARVTRS